MIRLTNIALSFKKQTVFNNISLLLQPSDKIALAGPNGAGKSTLLKVIDGSQKLDGGTINVAKDMSVAYLPQEVVLQSSKSIFNEAMDAFGRVGVWHTRMLELEAQGLIATEEYVHLHSELAEHGYGEKSARASTVLAGLGFSLEQQEKMVDTLSVGWQMRVVLAKLLLKDADFYLFDEPTNHLDLPAREWFCSFLRQMRGGYILISHDRYLLDNGCEKTAIIERGGITMYNSNYARAQAQMEKDAAIRAQQRATQQKEIAQMKQSIERFRAKANKAKMAQSMMKQLARIEVIGDDYSARTVRVPKVSVPRAGKIALRVDDLAKSFGEKQIFKDVSCVVPTGKKIALIAPNGVGKTTLLSCMAGVLSYDEGNVELGHNISLALFEQEQVRVLQPEATVLQEVENACHPEMRDKVRAMLGAFLFSGDDVFKRIKVLSGGERNRVAMAKVLLQNANLLMLDEPTNHLDLPSKQILLEALQAYEGTILFVSHDRDFVEHLADSLLVFDTQANVSFYHGDYTSWQFDQQQKGQGNAAPAAKKKEKKKKVVVSADNRAKELKKAEARAEKCEIERDRCAEALGQHEYGTPAYNKALEAYEDASDLLDEATKEWEELYE